MYDPSPKPITKCVIYNQVLQICSHFACVSSLSDTKRASLPAPQIFLDGLDLRAWLLPLDPILWDVDEGRQVAVALAPAAVVFLRSRGGQAGGLSSLAAWRPAACVVITMQRTSW